MDENRLPPLTLRLLTPTGMMPEVRCDSVRLTLADDARGQGGGSVGVRRGHAAAILALGAGPIRASLEGREVCRVVSEGGFASVEDDVVTVIADSISPAGPDGAVKE